MFNYDPPAIHQEIQWKYRQSVPNQLLQNDIGEDVSSALKYKKQPVNLIDGNRRNEIVTYVVDNKRAFKDRKSTRLNSSHVSDTHQSRMPSSA